MRRALLLAAAAAASAGGARVASSTPSSAASFFATPLKAVVGASQDREKFGNKVLRTYLEHKMAAVPINKKTLSIEGLACVPSLQDLRATLSAANAVASSFDQVGVSIITPPGVTKLILQEGKELGIKHFLLQPGTYDAITDEFIKTEMSSANIVKSCVMVELGFSEH